MVRINLKFLYNDCIIHGCVTIWFIFDKDLWFSNTAKDDCINGNDAATPPLSHTIYAVDTRLVEHQDLCMCYAVVLNFASKKRILCSGLCFGMHFKILQYLLKAFMQRRVFNLRTFYGLCSLWFFIYSKKNHNTVSIASMQSMVFCFDIF